MTTKIPVELSSTPSIVDNGDATAITIDSSENVGIGETSPASKLHISATGEARLIVEGDSDNDVGEESALIEFRTDGGAVRHRIEATGSGGNDLKITAGADQTTNTLNSEIIFETKTANSSAAERMRIDSDGNVGIGVSSVVRQPLQVHRASTSDVQIHMTNSATGSTASDGMTIFSNSTTSGFWQRESANMLFATASTERMRIDSAGDVFVGKTGSDAGTAGVELAASGRIWLARSDTLLYLNRTGSDGDLVSFRQDGSEEGKISVSGAVISYQGFSGTHESSGIASNTAIGTVCSTIDELDTYVSGTKEGQTRADHAKIKVSDTEGDSRVYGVLSSYSEEDNKPIVASVGIGSVLVTGACAGGDLLESNGDGTAKVQDDDIIRSKTIGKVTIGNSDTNVKLVSCVLYCG